MCAEEEGRGGNGKGRNDEGKIGSSKLQFGENGVRGRGDIVGGGSVKRGVETVCTRDGG